jgi:UrcA family protein
MIASPSAQATADLRTVLSVGAIELVDNSSRKNAVNQLAIMLAVLATATTAPQALAKSHVGADGAPYGLVHTAGLDLASPVVVRKLQNRVRLKANSICPDAYETTEMEPSPERRHCLEVATSNGFSQIEAMHLAALAKSNSNGATSLIPTGLR